MKELIHSSTGHSLSTIDKMEVQKLSQKGHDVHVMNQLRLFDSDEEMCDVVLTAGEYSVQAHKLILSANSDYFRAMFTGNWNEKEKRDIVLHELTADGLKAVVQFCYHGEITVALDNIRDILSAIHHCQISKAYKIIERYLGRSLNVINFLKLYELADMFNMEDLKKSGQQFACDEFIVKHIEGENPLWKLEANLLQQIVENYDFNNIGYGHFAVFEFVMKWAQVDFGIREEHIPQLLRCIDVVLTIGLYKYF
jgi:hypothetical protein